MPKAKNEKGAQKSKYAKQQLRTAGNKARSRKKHLQENPNDLQAKRDLAGKV